MKKLLPILVAVAFCALSCTELGIATIQFSSTSGTFDPDSVSTPVGIRVNLAQDTDCSISVKASYYGEKDEIASMDLSVTLPAGELEVDLYVPNSVDTGEEIASIMLTLNNLPSGFMWGGRLVCVLTPSESETLSELSYSPA